MTDTPETNERGNQITRGFRPDIDRYHFDFGQCSHDKGWQQFDTDQDASYFGVWVHPEQRKIVTYAEGDITRVTCPTAESYRAELEDMCSFYGTAPAFIGIDDDGTVTEYYQDRGEFLASTPEPD